MTTFESDVRHQPHLEPVEKPRPVDVDEYQATTCPICFGPLKQRIRGLWCQRDRGWLVEELRDGRIVYRLLQL